MIRVGVLTGGGDCPGLNGAIKWVVKTTRSNLPKKSGETVEVIGIRDGWKGLVSCDTSKIYPAGTPLEGDVWLKFLSEREVRPWDRYGGTQLGTSRTNPFNPANERSALVIENIQRLKLDALVAIGGEDTLSVAARLSEKGLPVVGIPKTIDKDLWGTEYSLGFESAVNVVTEEIDRLRTTAGSHRRIFVVETMGRYAGHLALQGGMAAGAIIILIPEHDFDMARINAILSHRKERGVRYSIIIVAEEQIIRDGKEDDFKHKTLGGIGVALAGRIHDETGLETRSVVLSHLQRGGVPCAYDRRMARSFGIAAVNLIQAGMFGNMVAFKEGRCTMTPLMDVIGKQALVDVAIEYDTERYNGKRDILRLT
jgi:6-phosphofructokinase